MTSANSPGQASDAAAGAARLLIVDDNADAADTLADLLRVLGYEVRCAGDGASAMAVLGEYAPQLALLDIGLPGEDGYALAKRIRDEPGLSDLKLVALTGYGSEGDRAQAFASRFDEHLVKPVAIDRLLEVMGKLLD